MINQLKKLLGLNDPKDMVCGYLDKNGGFHETEDRRDNANIFIEISEIDKEFERRLDATVISYVTGDISITSELTTKNRNKIKEAFDLINDIGASKYIVTHYIKAEAKKTDLYSKLKIIHKRIEISSIDQM